MAALSQHPSRPTDNQSSDRLDHASATPRSSISEQSTVAPTHVTTYSHGHRHTISISRLNQQRSSSGGILALAAAAFDRTQNAISAIAEPTIRPRQSSGTLSRLSLLTSPSPSSEPSSPEKHSRLRSTSSQSLLAGANLDSKIASQSGPASLNHPPSRPYTSTDPNLPPPVKSPSTNKMHQTSSRLLRMTDDDRPFTKVCTISHFLS